MSLEGEKYCRVGEVKLYHSPEEVPGAERSSKLELSAGAKLDIVSNVEGEEAEYDFGVLKQSLVDKFVDMKFFALEADAEASSAGGGGGGAAGDDHKEGEVRPYRAEPPAAHAHRGQASREVKQVLEDSGDLESEVEVVAADGGMAIVDCYIYPKMELYEIRKAKKEFSELQKRKLELQQVVADQGEKIKKGKVDISWRESCQRLEAKLPALEEKCREAEERCKREVELRDFLLAEMTLLQNELRRLREKWPIGKYGGVASHISSEDDMKDDFEYDKLVIDESKEYKFRCPCGQQLVQLPKIMQFDDMVFDRVHQKFCIACASRGHYQCENEECELKRQQLCTSCAWHCYGDESDDPVVV